MSTEIESLRTIGEIAKERGIPAHRVLYAILSRRVSAVRTVGGARVFDAQAVAEIDRALRETAANHSVSHRAAYETR